MQQFSFGHPRTRAYYYARRDVCRVVSARVNQIRTELGAVAGRLTIRTAIPKTTKISYSSDCAMVVVGGAAIDFTRRRTTMIVIGIILSFVALAYLCWLLFALAIYALPFFAAASVGLAAYKSGSGLAVTIVIGVIAGGIVLVLGRVAFAWLHSPVMRAALALLFIVPAAVAGYHAARGLAYFFIPAEVWRDAIAIVGAIIVAATAWVRMAVSAPPNTKQGNAADMASPDPSLSCASEVPTRHL